VVKLGLLAQGLLDNLADFAGQISADVGKPISMARAEVRRSAELLQVVARESARPQDSGAGPALVRRRPLGIVGIITPWNNPLAIPVGKLAPAIAYGNGVLWKPAPAGTMVAHKFLALWRHCDETAPIALVTGDSSAALAIANEPRVDALTLSGSLVAGHALAEIAARRHVPWQAELGGNNAAIIGTNADLERDARHVALGAFGFAGQRCTANRRAIVPIQRLEEWCQALCHAAQELPWGDPLDERTVIGPVISRAKQQQLEALIGRAREAGARVIATHADAAPENLPGPTRERGAYCAPTIVVCADARQEIVQEESFGPILVVQPAHSFDEALALCNGVRQGLAAALLGGTPDESRRFLVQVHAGILKLNQSTVDADAVSPFGGWKASGAGPAEHGICDREFYTRVQTVYGLAGENHP
jgi:acyl-CoA reductase-like NAD-dependent aldehyde dehydrogenase